MQTYLHKIPYLLGVSYHIFKLIYLYIFEIPFKTFQVSSFVINVQNLVAFLKNIKISYWFPTHQYVGLSLIKMFSSKSDQWLALSGQKCLRKLTVSVWNIHVRVENHPWKPLSFPLIHMGSLFDVSAY